MRRIVALGTAVMLVALSASPTLAQRASSNLDRGYVKVAIFDNKLNPDECAMKVSGNKLADGQQVFVGGYPYGQGGDAWYIGDTNADGGVTSNNSTHTDDTMNKMQVLVVVRAGWYAVEDVDGNQATWSISNTCKN